MTTTANANIEQGVRLKLRWESQRGQLSMEELYDLPLTSKSDRPNLDAIAIDLHEKIEAQGTKSFVRGAKKDEILQLKFDIVKHIIDVKQAENEAKLEENTKQAKRDKLDRLIENAEDAELAGKSPEELRALRASL